MKYRKRIYYTEADKALMWDRWQKGDTLHEIARLFDRHHSSVQGILGRTGGIRPPVRRRSSRTLTLAEREEISRGIASDRSLRSIALRLGRSPSTISRELARNGGSQGYRAHAADQAAWDQALRPKRCRRNIGATRGQAAAAAVVAVADRRLAEAGISARRDAPGVTRDHLQDAVHSGPRGPEQRTAGASASQPRDASLTSLHAEERRSWPHHRCGQYPRATG